MGSSGENYVIPDLYHSQITKPIKAISVGCGISGLCLAYKMMEGLESFSLTIYEKNSDIGGT
jgi:cation diffusion facilitator CzcD-associated flavoprotein CzcO